MKLVKLLLLGFWYGIGGILLILVVFGSRCVLFTDGYSAYYMSLCGDQAPLGLMLWGLIFILWLIPTLIILFRKRKRVAVKKK